MIRQLVLSFALCLLLPGSWAQADSWIFNRSYYSHAPVQNVRVGTQQAASGPVFTRPTGQFVRGGFRRVRSVIQTPYGSVDQINYFESWIQGGAQF